MSKLFARIVRATVLPFIASASPALAQSWPARPITMIVPFTAGSTTDMLARSLGEFTGAKVGQSFVVENRTGAGGNIAGAAAAKAAPDGHTLLLASTGPAANNKLMYKSMPYDPQTDLTPIVLIGQAPVIIVARNGLPANDIPGLIAHAKANPGKVSAAYPGNGTLGHITGELLQVRSGVQMLTVQHRGSATMLNDLFGGHLDIAMDSLAPYVPQVQQGKIKALAIAGAKRWPKLPGVPTVAEAGIPGFEASVWYALLAPKGTPPDIIARLNAAANEFLQTPKTKTMFEDLGIEATGGTQEELKRFIESELTKWAPVIKAANISF